jgi:monofunctional biosynthetic peptidoglycan transglycosylase
MVRAFLRIVLRLVVAVVAIVVALTLVYRWIDPPGTPLMAIRWIEGAAIDHRGAGRPPPALARAVVAAEDNRFCDHWGIDLDAVRDAIEDYEEGGRLRGASTITMQVARNLFLWPGGGFLRKAAEAPIALLIDLAWPMRRVMEVYLVVAEWGEGTFGAEAAAQRHFRKPAAALSASEAARLAAVLPSPRRWSAAQPSAYVARRARTIETRVQQLGAGAFRCLS